MRSKKLGSPEFQLSILYSGVTVHRPLSSKIDHIAPNESDFNIFQQLYHSTASSDDGTPQLNTCAYSFCIKYRQLQMIIECTQEVGSTASF